MGKTKTTFRVNLTETNAYCHHALRTIVAFGERGLNPIATMLPARQRTKTDADD